MCNAKSKDFKMAQQVDTIQITGSEKAFLENYAKRHASSVNKLIKDYIQLLKLTEDYSYHPDIEKFAGIIKDDPDPQGSYRDHIWKKHQ